MRILERKSCFAVFAAALVAAGCAHAGRAERPKQAAWIRTELYFGAPAADEWERFLAESVTPRFPAGLTVYEASGQWKGRDGAVHKVPTRVLMVLHPPDAESAGKIEAVRREFLSRFHHESVLRVDAPAGVSF